MSEPAIKSVISGDAVVEGDIVTRGQVTIGGRVQGDVSAHAVEIAEKGGIYGALRAETADVYGSVQGDVSIRGLIRISKSGSVNGNVEYGRISLEPGGMLSASLRNVPPKLGGDLDVTVARGGAVRITTLDLTAFDPDDAADALTYAVSNAKGGFLALAAARDVAVTNFTQDDLEHGRVFFVHDGGADAKAGFDTVVSDAKGATSGETRHVTVNIRG